MGLGAESLAYYAFWAGFGLAVASTVCYLAAIVALPGFARPAATSAGVILVSHTSSPSGSIKSASAFLAVLTLAALSLSLALRAYAVERPPLGNLWEFTVAFAWGIVLFSVVADRVFRPSSLAVVLMPSAVVLMVIAILFFPHVVGPLVPALQANRILGIHVGTMLLAYSAFSVSFAAAVLYLIQVRKDGSERASLLPSKQVLEDVAGWSVLIGFPLLALGLILGAWWANNAWGRYWGWDPKETSALATWLIYAIYLHGRGLRGWSGHRLSILLILGFGAVLFTYFAVNFWISGLHSYAGV